MKRLNEPNMITLFVGIFLGIVVGSIPIAFPGVSVPMKLGLAGGPLVPADADWVRQADQHPHD